MPKPCSGDFNVPIACMYFKNKLWHDTRISQTVAQQGIPNKIIINKSFNTYSTTLQTRFAECLTNLPYVYPLQTPFMNTRVCFYFSFDFYSKYS